MAASAARTARASTTIPEGGQKRLWPGLADLQPTQLDPDTIDVEELKQRLLVTQALEAARTVEEGVVTDPREADVGSILGFGFAPFTGGALSYIDFMGAKALRRALPQSSKRSTARASRPNKLLRDMAESGDTFYGPGRRGERRKPCKDRGVACNGSGAISLLGFAPRLRPAAG